MSALEKAKDTTAATAQAPAQRKPVIDPAWVKENAAGICWREFSIRLPEGATLADLNESPGLWKFVQGDRTKSLVRLDRVVIFNFEESWCVDAIVAGATMTNVSLAGIRKTDLPPRTEALYQDDNYAIAWMGNGYVVKRKSDGNRMTQPVPSLSEARNDLTRLYSRPFS